MARESDAQYELPFSAREPFLLYQLSAARELFSLLPLLFADEARERLF